MLFKKCIALASLAILIFSCQSQPNEKWLLGFEKTDINPIMRADSSFVFHDPITETLVQWQKADVFNPAAIVKNDTVFIGT